MKIDLKGSMVAIVSPMLKGGQLDLQTFNKLVEWHISEGTNAIVVVGTTGLSLRRGGKQTYSDNCWYGLKFNRGGFIFY